MGVIKVGRGTVVILIADSASSTSFTIPKMESLVFLESVVFVGPVEMGGAGGSSGASGSTNHVRTDPSKVVSLTVQIPSVRLRLQLEWQKRLFFWVIPIEGTKHRDMSKSSRVQRGYLRWIQ